jgi:histidinol-phosphate aminotransferase
VQILSNTKAPYNIAKPTASLALSALSPSGLSVLDTNIRQLIQSRKDLSIALKTIPSIGRILGGNHANFLLVEVLESPGGKASNSRAVAVYKKMAEELGVVVRFRGNELGCEGCLRVTVGTKSECDAVVDTLRGLLQ